MNRGDLVRRTFQLICKYDQFRELTIRLVTPDMAEYKVGRKKWFYLDDYFKQQHPNFFRKLTVQYNPSFYEKSSENTRTQFGISLQDPIDYSREEEYLDH